MSKISIVKGEGRKENIKKAAGHLEKDIEKAIKLKKSNQLFIKVNAIDSNISAARTHTDALEAVLEIFYEKFDKIIVGDNSYVFYKDRGGPYRAVLNKFPRVKLSDLTEFESEDIEFKLIDGKVGKGKISLIHKKAFSISLALPKTHDAFVYTGCLKNMFGCVTEGRGHLHALRLLKRLIINKDVETNKIKLENLISVINKTMPDLCILDAYEGMEGNGPLHGKKVKIGVAMCSLDGILIDKVASKICGMNHVPYLFMLSHDSDNAEMIKEGFEDLEEISKKFKMHYNHKYQIATSLNSSIPLVDIRLFLYLLKRWYRIKDKLIKKNISVPMATV